MLTKKKTVSVVAALIISLTPVIGAMPAYAADSTTTAPHNFFEGLVQFISQKFGLDKGQVQSAVNDYHTQQKQKMVATMQQKDEDRLSQLVKDGKITDAQKQAILTEQAALKAKYSPDTFKNLSQDDRKQKMQDLQNEIKSWAQSQSIDPQYIMPFGGFKTGMRMGFRMGKWSTNHPSVTPTQTQ